MSPRIDEPVPFTPAWLKAPPDLPLDRPFTRAQARAAGLTDRELSLLVKSGYLIHPIRGVYYAAELGDSLTVRLESLRLVVPADVVITDRTAAWLLGAPRVLAPGDHRVVPKVSAFRRPGYRLRNEVSASGERTFKDEDLIEIGGLVVTGPLRTACDLGRLLHRDQAFAAMDAVIRLGHFTVGELVTEVERFKGYRGVRQLRGLAPWVDPRSESPGESILRLRWLDIPNLPRPELQIEVSGPDGPCFLDLGLRDLRYAAEYDGVEWHGPLRQEHDRRRREWIARRYGFHFDVFTGADIHGPSQDASRRLTVAIRRAPGATGGR